MSNKYPGGIITSGAPAGYSVFFDGTGDYLSIANNTALDLTGDFTIECWVYLTNVSPGYNPTIVARWGASGGQIYTFQVLAGGTFRFITSAGTWTGGSVSANTWTHLAVSRSGSSLRLFNAGALSSTNTDSTSLSGTQVTSIGGENNGAQSVPGYVSNVRIVKGTALYTAAFTPPTQLFAVTNTSLLTCNSPAIVDQSSNNFTITANGNAAVSTFTPFQGYVAYNPALGAATPGIWTVSDAIQAAQTRRWNMYDPYFNYTTLLLHGNGTNGAQNNTFLDSSSNNFTITRNGNTTQGTFSPFSQTGWSNYFDGTGDFLTTPSNTAFEFGTGDFTVEFWAYVQNSASVALVGTRTGDTVSTIRWGFFIDTSGFLSFQAYNSADALIGTIAFQTAFPRNSFVHCAVVRSGTSFRLYQNGVQSTSSLTSSDIMANNSNVVRVGDYDTSSLPDLNGYISNLRITKGGALYTSGFTPSTTPLTTTVSAGTVSLLTCQSNRFIDNSSNAFSLTIGGTPSVQAFSPFYPLVAYTPQAQGGSGYFDGTTDYLVASGAALDTGAGTSDVTFECWVYNNGYSGSQYGRGIFTFYKSTDYNNNRLMFRLDSASNKINCFLVVGGSLLFGVSGTNSTASATPSAWTHLALVRSSQTFKLYINGALDTTLPATTASLSGFDKFDIGRTQDGTVPEFNGNMAGFRYLKGTAQYTAAFTPPTAPPTAITNTQLLLNYTNAGIIDSTGDNVLETAGNAQISTTQSKFGGSSLYFDGTGDYLQSSDTNLCVLGSSDWTIEFWLNPTANNATAGLVVKESASANGYNIYLSSSGKLSVALSSNGTSYDINVNGSTTLNTGTWYYCAIVRSGSGTNNVKVYVNGSQDAQATFSSSINNAGSLRIGSRDGASQYFYGYMDDLRITKGYARYTGNFTPQTSQWQDQ